MSMWVDMFMRAEVLSLSLQTKCILKMQLVGLSNIMW